uniref:Secreted protein n=1 Tax=Rousettus aegyptiacus TaxID=9407 RepID=A0A7J8DHZ5_ROUAE|nr:hypothetical protein HJG63_008653 [Rousettus aegyptiacus]
MMMILLIFAISRTKVLHALYNIHAFFYPAKDHVLAIQPLSFGNANEKLGTFCVGSGTCHGQDTRTCMFQDEILIIKFLPVDGLAIHAIMMCEVTTLAHKSQNNSIKTGTFIPKSFLLVLLSLELGLQTARRRHGPKAHC